MNTVKLLNPKPPYQLSEFLGGDGFSPKPIHKSGKSK